MLYSTGVISKSTAKLLSHIIVVTSGLAELEMRTWNPANLFFVEVAFVKKI